MKTLVNYASVHMQVATLENGKNLHSVSNRKVPHSVSIVTKRYSSPNKDEPVTVHSDTSRDTVALNDAAKDTYNQSVINDILLKELAKLGRVGYQVVNVYQKDCGGTYCVFATLQQVIRWEEFDQRDL